MSELKRKRRSEKGERPAKKVAFQAPETVKFQVLEDNDVLGPVIASTPGLSYPSQIPLKPYKSGIVGGVLPPGKKLPYKLILQSSQHPKLDYTAREEQDGSADSLLQHYVGVYDPVSGELKLMEAHKVTVRSTLRSVEEMLRQEREAAAQTKAPTMTSKMETLGMEFGNKKTRSAINDRTVNAIARDTTRLTSPGGTIPPPASDSVAAAVVGSMDTSAAKVPTQAEQLAAIEEHKPRPKAEMDAKTPPEVYPISTLIGNEIMSAISVKDWMDAVEAKVPVKVPSQFVAKRIQRIAGEKDIKKLKVLKFILHLIKFKDALIRRGGMKSAQKLPERAELAEKVGAPMPLMDALKRKFASEKNDMTRWHVDYLITHVCAAALIVDSFEVDTYELREDLKLTSSEIAQFFREIGAKESPPTEAERAALKIIKAEASAHRIAKLKLPLVFPKQRVAATKRRGR